MTATILVMAGGTGGHVFPALAVARVLRSLGHRVVWLGTRRGIEIAVDPSRYFEFEQLAIRGTQRFDLNVHEKGTASVAGPVIMLSTPAS